MISTIAAIFAISLLQLAISRYTLKAFEGAWYAFKNRDWLLFCLASAVFLFFAIGTGVISIVIIAGISQIKTWEAI